MLSPLFAHLAQEAAPEKTGIAVLGLDIKVLVLQAGVFVLLFFLLKKFALSGIVEKLEERRQTINQGVDLGLEMKQKKAEFEEELKKLHHEARAQADEILAGANKEAGEIIQAGEASATTKVDQMLKDAEARIESEMAKARKSLQAEMQSLVAEATEAIIGEKLDASKDASLIERALAKVRG